MTAPLDQLRCLGDDEPGSIYSWPLIYWLKKQVEPPPEVNVFELEWACYREIEQQSPALLTLKQNGIDRAERLRDPRAKARWAAFLEDIGRQVDAAHCLDDYYGGW